MTQDPDIPHLDPAPGAEHAADVTGLIEEILHRPVDVDVDAHPTEPVHEAVSGQVWFEQAADGLCAPASVAMVVAAFTGGGSGGSLEDRAVAEAERLGLLTVGPEGFSGMTPQDTATLLVDMGVPAHVEQGTVEDLETYLDGGRAVVLSVDSHELRAWNEQDVSERPDHAVVVSEIDRETGLVYLEDPGHPEGRNEVLTIAQLQDAWNDSDNTMVVTDRPEGEHSGTLTVPQRHLPTAGGEGEAYLPSGFVLLPLTISRLLHP